MDYIKLETAKKYICDNNFDEALTVLNDLKKENNADVFFELGKIYFLLNDFKLSAENFKLSFNIKPSDMTAVMLAKSYKYLNKKRQALSLLADIKKSDVSGKYKDIDLEIALILTETGKLFFALRYIDRYLNSNIELKTNLAVEILLKKDTDIILKYTDYIFNLLTYDIKKDARCLIENKFTDMYISGKLQEKTKFFNYIADKFNSGCSIQYYNKILNALEIADKKYELISKPPALTVTLTSLCNIKCRFCEIHNKSQWILPDDRLKQIEELMPYLTYISWLGGEVFLYDKFERLFDLAKKYNIKQELITNGLLLTDKWIKKFSDTDMRLCVSVTSADRAKYEKLHYGADFNKLLRNLSKVKNIIKINPKFDLWLYVLVMESNYRELEDIIDFAYNYGFKTVRLQPLIPDTDGIFDNKYEKFCEVKEFLVKSILRAESYNININNVIPVSLDNFNSAENNIPDTLHKREIRYDLFCDNPWKSVIIKNGGDITFYSNCTEITENICKTDLNYIWNSDSLKNLRKKIAEHNFDQCNVNCRKYNLHRN